VHVRGLVPETLLATTALPVGPAEYWNRSAQPVGTMIEPHGRRCCSGGQDGTLCRRGSARWRVKRGGHLVHQGRRNHKPPVGVDETCLSWARASPNRSACRTSSAVRHSRSSTRPSIDVAGGRVVLAQSGLVAMNLVGGELGHLAQAAPRRRLSARPGRCLGELPDVAGGRVVERRLVRHGDGSPSSDGKHARAAACSRRGPIDLTRPAATGSTRPRESTASGSRRSGFESGSSRRGKDHVNPDPTETDHGPARRPAGPAARPRRGPGTLRSRAADSFGPLIMLPSASTCGQR